VTSFTSMMDVTGFRLEVLADPSFPDMGPGRFANGNFHLTEFQVNATAVPEPAFGLLGSPTFWP
jgi:hypothetical protein